MTQAAFPHTHLLSPDAKLSVGEMGPRALPFKWTIGAGVSATWDLVKEIEGAFIANIQAVYIDNSGNSSAVTLGSSEITGMQVVVGPNSQGVFPFYGKVFSKLTLSTQNSSAVGVTVIFFNTPNPYASWSLGSAPPPVNPILALNPIMAFDPQDASTLFQEIASPSTPSGNNGLVGTMKDISPNGNNAVAPSTGARPILTIGAHNFITFDGVNDLLNIVGAALANTNYTIVCATSFPTTPATNDMILAGSTGGNDQNATLGWSTSTDFMFGHWGTSAADAGNPGFGTAPFVSSAIGQGGPGSFALTLRLNGGTTFTAPGTRNPLSSFTGAALAAFPVFGNFTNMQLYRFAAFNRALSASDLTAAEAWATSGFTP